MLPHTSLAFAAHRAGERLALTPGWQRPRRIDRLELEGVALAGAPGARSLILGLGAGLGRLAHVDHVLALL